MSSSGCVASYQMYGSQRCIEFNRLLPLYTHGNIMLEFQMSWFSKMLEMHMWDLEHLALMYQTTQLALLHGTIILEHYIITFQKHSISPCHTQRVRYVVTEFVRKPRSICNWYEVAIVTRQLCLAVGLVVSPHLQVVLGDRGVASRGVVISSPPPCTESTPSVVAISKLVRLHDEGGTMRHWPNQGSKRCASVDCVGVEILNKRQMLVTRFGNRNTSCF